MSNELDITLKSLTSISKDRYELLRNLRQNAKAREVQEERLAQLYLCGDYDDSQRCRVKDCDDCPFLKEQQKTKSELQCYCSINPDMDAQTVYQYTILFDSCPLKAAPTLVVLDTSHADAEYHNDGE